MNFQISEEIQVIENLLLETKNDKRKMELSLILEFLREQIGV